MNEADGVLLAIGVGLVLMALRTIHPWFLPAGIAVALPTMAYGIAFLPNRWLMNE